MLEIKICVIVLNKEKIEEGKYEKTHNSGWKIDSLLFDGINDFAKIENPQKIPEGNRTRNALKFNFIFSTKEDEIK